ncbi:hypothetical protein [Parasitella parasitica]|uniref:Fungal-type protein kinase domain-containing protein n=1 Tax=Parasitella parasitica TaxID=35722 RepID=A0A0B7N821_9FUNG|nr:hypothetical protein [Parasitella parasitica]
MNNILDLTENTKNSQQDCFSSEQQQQLETIFHFNPQYCSLDAEQEIDSLLRNVSAENTFNKDFSNYTVLSGSQKLAQHKDENTKPVELHAEDSEVFDQEANLSEGDYIVKIWGPVIEKLFRGKKVFTHWGDTISANGNEETLNRKMDLRFLCMTNKCGADVGDAEFGKIAFQQKYYYDKQKLVTNGKNQLNQILKNYYGQPSDVKLCLLQVLGFEAVIYCMWLDRDGVYVLKKIKEFDMPTRATTLDTDTKNLMDGLSILQSLVYDLAALYNDICKKRNKMKALTQPMLSYNKTAWHRTIWTPPPRPQQPAKTT